ncbi:hypothetical protein GCM10010286_64160 [Streptomyces toxytricini]|nr:hypothetical protein GCM10010286_64160 [Streptomyces toxytricini]
MAESVLGYLRRLTPMLLTTVPKGCCGLGICSSVEWGRWSGGRSARGPGRSDRTLGGGAARRTEAGGRLRQAAALDRSGGRTRPAGPGTARRAARGAA